MAITVAPCAGAWIEIAAWRHGHAIYLKVAPCAGAWIEISGWPTFPRQAGVAPCAGAWIEIAGIHPRTYLLPSLPVRERGLKFLQKIAALKVTGRSLCGSVD